MRGHILERSLLVGALLMAIPGVLLGQRDRHRDRDRDRERDRDEREGPQKLDTTVAFGRTGTVDLTLISGDIRVTGWDRGEVQLHATSDGGSIRFEASPAHVSVDLHPRSRSSEARFDVSVPAGTRVLMRGVSANLSSRGVRGEVEARTTSGDVEIIDGIRKVSAGSISGAVKVRHIEGDVQAESVSGDVEVREVKGDVDVETVSGELRVDGARARTVRMATVSADIEYDGTIDPAGRYDFRTHSGSVRLTLPRGTGATVRGETYSGSFESCFPVTLQPGQHAGGQPRRFEFKIGDGSARIAAETFSGDIDIDCGDARRPNPER
ncbi:MAG: DUF4097 family beta strand repeat-containing protein [Gemmatimonadota bacterium]|nr:DUF4097 family beta strand repeat-containing protein [Gemmatimonadota bacterium]